MHTLHFYAPLGDHISRYRRIDTATEQTHRSAANAGGQTACARLRRTVDIGSQIPHLNIDRIFRLMHIYFTGGMGFCQSAAYFLGNFDRGHCKPFIRTFRLHLKGCSAIQIVAKVLLDGIVNLIDILFTGAAAAKTDKTENCMTGFPCAVNICLIIHRLHVYSGLHQIYIKIAVSLHSAANILTQFILKLALIGAF